MRIRTVLDLVSAIDRGIFDPPPRQLDLFGEIVEYERRYKGVPRRVMERHFGGLSAKDRQSAMAFFPACVFCRKMVDLTLDHVWPLINGYPLRPGNVVRLCRSCNSSKGARSPERLSVDQARLILEAAASFLAYHQARSYLPFLPFFDADHLSG